MNRYVIEYSTGEYDDYAEYTKPMIYNGTKDQLKIEFMQSKKKLESRSRIANMLSKLGMLDARNRTWCWQGDMIKIGSREFDISNFIERGVLYPPTIQTVDEWYRDENE